MEGGGRQIVYLWLLLKSWKGQNTLLSISAVTHERCIYLPSFQHLSQLFCPSLPKLPFKKSMLDGLRSSHNWQVEKGWKRKMEEGSREERGEDWNSKKNWSSRRRGVMKGWASHLTGTPGRFKYASRPFLNHFSNNHSLNDEPLFSLQIIKTESYWAHCF